MGNRKVLVIALAFVAAVLVGSGVAIAGGDDAEPPITGPALEQATDAAISHLGEGTVTDTEVGDEESYYEVEVTLDDGRQIDVQLDEDFNVVGTEDDGVGDDEAPGEDD